MRALNEGSIEEVMSTLLEARELTPEHYSVWHAWAVVNYDQLQAADVEKAANPELIPSRTGEFLTRKGNRSAVMMRPERRRASSGDFTDPVTTSTYATPGKMKRKKSVIVQGTVSLANLLSLKHEDKISVFVAEAIKGFVRSIILGQGQPSSSVLQDTLRLLTLWFSYGSKEGVVQIVETELDKLSPENWLSVLPQLIARIHVKSTEISGVASQTSLFMLAVYNNHC